MESGHEIDYALLVDRCINGDADAWQELVDKIVPVIFSIAAMMRLSREEAFDIFGQVCYLLLTNLKNLRSREKVIGYVATITRREILRVNKRQKLIEKVDEETALDQIGTKSSRPDSIYEESYKLEIIIKTLARIPEKEADLIWALFLDENEPSYEEIAQKLDMPIASIGPTRMRALKKLEKLLKKYDF